MAAPTREIVYAHPSPGRARYGAFIMAAVVALIVLWPSYKVLGPLGFAVAAVATAGVLAWMRRFGAAGALTALKVESDPDAKVLRLEHRGGAVEVPWAEITAVESGTIQTGEGLTLDAVTLRRGEGEPVVFSVTSAGAAEGAARAIRAVMGEGATTEG